MTNAERIVGRILPGDDYMSELKFKFAELIDFIDKNTPPTESEHIKKLKTKTFDKLEEAYMFAQKIKNKY